ncbi:MAG: hypothetical protein NVS4B8_24610 [Herpetosiphon sp.]
MRSHSISTIARREIRDSLTDWRMMVPVLILTFVVPMLIEGALLFLLAYLQDNHSVVRLIPFAVLLCGFLPASFSLIGALESFVGEKERNTLESLLAMPIGDQELYLGKLIAALASPLISSVMAMLTFILFTLAAFPSVVVNALTPTLLIEMVLLVMVKCVVMVSAAVIISTHTTTTRAANLMASLILVPMATLVQLEALLVIAGNRRTLLVVLLALLVVALILVRGGLAAFNREAILSREHTTINFRRAAWSFGRFMRAYHPFGAPPELYTESFSLVRFYRHELPALLRDYRLPLLLVALISGAASVGAGLLPRLGIGHLWETTLLSFVRPPAPGLAASIHIWLAQLRLTFFSTLIAPISFGVMALLVPVAAWSQLSYVTVWTNLHHLNSPQLLLGYMLPHGILQGPAAILSGALGLRVGLSMLYAAPGASIGYNLLWSFANWLKVWLLVVLPAFLAAALIEGFLIPLVLRSGG